MKTTKKGYFDKRTKEYKEANKNVIGCQARLAIILFVLLVILVILEYVFGIDVDHLVLGI